MTIAFIHINKINKQNEQTHRIIVFSKNKKTAEIDIYIYIAQNLWHQSWIFLSILPYKWDWMNEDRAHNTHISIE